MSLRWPLVEFALVLGVAAACLVFQLWLPSTHVAESDYQDVARVLAAESQPGDAVLLAPWWTERARMYLPPSVDVVGYQGSDGDDLETHPRVWVLAQPRQPRADYAGFYEKFAAGRTAVGQLRSFGNLQLQLFTNGRYRPQAFSALSMLAQSQVYLEQPDGQRVACQWDGHNHRCPKGWVGFEWREILFAPHYCLRFYPPGGDEKLVLELPPVPAASSIGVRGGLVWGSGYPHDARLSPTVLNLEVDGQVTSSLTFPAGVPGLEKVDSPPVREGARVRLTSRAQNPESRDLCVELYGFAASGSGTGSGNENGNGSPPPSGEGGRRPGEGS